MFPNGRNIKWTQDQSKHGICPKLRALGKYLQFISMKKSVVNWNYLFAEIKQRLIQQSTSTSSQSSHSNDKFFKKKKNIMNKSSSFLVHLHLLHFVIIKKSPFSKGKFSNRKNLQNHILKEKFSNEQIFNKNFQNFNGKISKNKSSRKNIHEQIFIKIFSKVQSPK